jgi:hypothetical protein
MSEQEHAVAYCGLYCGDCPFYKGEIADMARDLRKKLRQNKFDKFAAGMSNVFKDFAEYPQCYKVLGAMVKMRCRKVCRDGGGNPFCKIRACCNKKEITGCWECDDFETCKKLEFLKVVHDDAVFKNMRKIRKAGMETFLSGTKYW